MKLGLLNKLWSAAVVLVVASVPTAITCAQTWTGSGDSRDWNDALNWDAAVTGSSNLVFNATGTYRDRNNDEDIDLRFGANFTANSVTISGDYTANLEAGPASSGETHVIAGDGNNSNTINRCRPWSPFCR